MATPHNQTLTSATEVAQTIYQFLEPHKTDLGVAHLTLNTQHSTHPTIVVEATTPSSTHVEWEILVREKSPV